MYYLNLLSQPLISDSEPASNEQKIVGRNSERSMLGGQSLPGVVTWQFVRYVPGRGGSSC